MEPVQIGRDDALLWLMYQQSGVMPQWSPSRSDGMTKHVATTTNPLHTAAMEPVQIGRDDQAGGDGRLVVGSAAMEPVQIGRDDWSFQNGSPVAARAAMEPVQIGRDDSTRGRRRGRA